MKEPKKVNLSTLLIVMAIALIIILFLTYLLYSKGNIRKEQNVTNTSKVTETNMTIVNNVDNKIDNTTENVVNNSTNNAKINTHSEKIETIEGEFSSDDNYGTDAPLYTFKSDGTVACEGNALTKGTYKIENGKVNIEYNYFLAPETTVPEQDYHDNEVFIYIDENTLKTENGIIYEKIIPMSQKDLAGTWKISKTIGLGNRSFVDIGYGSLGPGPLTLNEDGTYDDNITPDSVNSDNSKIFTGTYSLENDGLKLSAKNGETHFLPAYSGKIIYTYEYNNIPYYFILKK